MSKISSRAPARTPSPSTPKPPMKGAPSPAAGWSPAAPRPPRADGVPVSTTTAASVVAPAAGQLGDLSVPTMMNAQAAEAVGTYALAHASGPLFVNGAPSPDDIDQGAAGDCYFLSTMATIANTHPEVIRDLIKKNDDGTFTVTFKQPDGRGGFSDVPVRVDDQLYERQYKDGAGNVFATMAAYGTSNRETSNQPQATEKALWLPLVEKAYAKLNGGSYENIGNGGWPRKVMTDVLGRPSTSFDASTLAPAEAWNRIKAAVDSGAPICASTLTDDASVANYTNSGLVHGHAYAVLGASEHDGAQYVKLRNPWGKTEPGNDGKDDGVFEMKFTDFLKFYNTVDLSPVRS